jgi:ATP/maltotriose-dependent transcriptional regulator MalT
VIRDGLAGLPAGCGAIFISRSEPPPAMARLRANRAMDILDWDDLRLTPEEGHDLVRLLAPEGAPAGTLETLHARADGWAAGLVLLLERLRLAETGAAPVGDPPAQVLFEYFAGEIFEQAEPETRRFLLETACLPTMTVRMAERLTGLSHAGRILAELHRTHYFTARRAGAEPI